MRTIITVAELPASGDFLIPYDAILTPLAADEAVRRGLNVREVAPKDAVRPAAPAEKTIALAADHGGFPLKEQLKSLLEQMGLSALDFGAHDEKPVDYPDFAVQAAEAVSLGRATRGIIVDGAGIGSAMVANKVPGVRAALCYDKASARNSREHNNANVLTLGGKLLSAELALEVAATWLATSYAGGRHEKRVAKIGEIEKRYIRSR